ncbi:hypothetical protein DFH09DRAFT_1307421 [Mycena vulgaris]|nr:hypothetical protein DFH09DRAFT_1307421 [Mycena vulgaris]
MAARRAAAPIESFSYLVAHHGPFPLLSSLSLSLDSHIFNQEPTITIRGAPLLRKVTLADFLFLTADIAWEQLTILKSSHTMRRSPYPFLQRCSNLVDLEFASGLDRAPLAISPFTIPSLQSFSMTGQSIRPFFTFPSLEQLNMYRSSGLSGHMGSPTESLLALLQRSACSLKRLSFPVTPEITTDTFCTFLLAALPIVELELTFWRVGASDLSLIAILQTAEVLPGLTTLHITDAANTTLFRHLDTLRARRKPVAGRALLDHSPYPSPDLGVLLPVPLKA